MNQSWNQTSLPVGQSMQLVRPALADEKSWEWAILTEELKPSGSAQAEFLIPDPNNLSSPTSFIRSGTFETVYDVMLGLGGSLVAYTMVKVERYHRNGKLYITGWSSQLGV